MEIEEASHCFEIICRGRIYRALASVISELIWISQLLIDLHVQHMLPTTVFCDNQAAVAIASHPILPSMIRRST